MSHKKETLELHHMESRAAGECSFCLQNWRWWHLFTHKHLTSEHHGFQELVMVIDVEINRLNVEAMNQIAFSVVLSFSASSLHKILALAEEIPAEKKTEKSKYCFVSFVAFYSIGIHWKLSSWMKETLTYWNWTRWSLWGPFQLRTFYDFMILQFYDSMILLFSSIGNKTHFQFASGWARKQRRNKGREETLPSSPKVREPLSVLLH